MGTTTLAILAAAVASVLVFVVFRRARKRAEENTPEGAIDNTGWCMAKVMRLNTNGPMSRVVRQKLNVGASILAFIWAIDICIWTACGWYILNNQFGDASFIAAVFIGFAVGSIIMLIDWAIITSDLFHRRNASAFAAVTLRASLALSLSFITAMPLEVIVFMDKVVASIDQREDGRKDDLKDKAREDVTSEYTVLVKDAEQALEKAKTDKEAFANKSVSTSNKELDDYTKAQDLIRASIVARYQTGKDREREIIDNQQQLALRESQGGLSGNKGRGPLVATLEQGVQSATARLKDLEDDEKAELKAHDEKVDKHKKELQANFKAETDKAAEKVEVVYNERQAKVDSLKDEKKAKLLAIKQVNTPEGYDELKAKHGPSWQEPRGFIPYMEELNRLSDENDTTKWGIWFCRIFFMILSMFVTFWKLTVGTPVKRYYSMGAAAKRGDQEMIEEVKAMGYDPEKFGVAPQVQKMLLAVANARVACRGVRREWHTRLAELAQKVDGRTGALEHRPIGEVNMLLGQWGRDHYEVVDSYRRLINEAEAMGISTGDQSDFAWALDSEPFAAGSSALQRHGWESPQEVIIAGRKAELEILELAERLGAGFENWTHTFGEWVSTNRQASLVDVNEAYRKFFRSHVRGPRRLVLRAQGALKLAQRSMPELRPELAELLAKNEHGIASMQVDVDRVLRPLGWTGPEALEPPPVTPSLPAPTTPPTFPRTPTLHGAPAPPATVECPHCNHPDVPWDATECPKCSGNMATSKAAPLPADVPCDNCGEAQPSGNEHCTACGVKMGHYKCKNSACGHHQYLVSYSYCPTCGLAKGEEPPAPTTGAGTPAP